MKELINLESQPLASEFFNQSLTKNHMARSYLLTGRALEDKLELIKQINLVLNCQLNIQSASLNAPCMQCQNCRWIAADTHPRTPLILKPEEDDKKNNDEDETTKVRRKQIIKMEQAQGLLTELSQSSEYFRIVIIEDASLKTLKPDSATVLLKTIEEAKANTMFMLLSESKDAVLLTLVSRSQVVHFNNTEIKEYQEQSHELYADLKQWLETSSAKSQLEQIIKAEKLAEADDGHLIEMLALLQNEYANKSHELNSANLVLELETAIGDIRSFVRKKAVLAPLLKQLG